MYGWDADGHGRKRGRAEAEQDISCGTPGRSAAGTLDEYRTPAVEDLPPFTGGLVGYFAYDHVKYAEPSLKSVLASSGEGKGFRDVDLMLFDKVIVFDNYRQKLILVTGVSLTGDLDENCLEAERKLNEMERLIRSQAKADFRPLVLKDFRRPGLSGRRTGACVAV